MVESECRVDGPRRERHKQRFLRMATTCLDYDFASIEPHWQARWAEKRAFAAVTGSEHPKYYILDMFPYPSGSGLHVGHTENYTASDILDRFHRARGFNVLHPMGWDAFGLPAEQYAVKTGIHPALTTRQNIDQFRRQIKRLGVAIDWDREVNTTDPGYYRWTQWIFLQLFKHGLAYVDERPVWYCPALGTVLANEEVVDGVSEVGGFPVERRALRQWVLRITAYADRLLAGLDQLQWPESTKTQQRYWIGRSDGAEIVFQLEGLAETVTVFTTRPDTIFGATYLVLAPEHPLASRLTTPEQSAAVADYIRQTAAKSDLARTDLAKEKTGVRTGGLAVHPLSGEKIPVWIADYVLPGYGTGAIMAVPAHDTRDFEFATRYQLPIKRVIDERDANGLPRPLPSTGAGSMTASGIYDGLPSEIGQKRIVEELEAAGHGRGAVQYRLRDWLFSRQRYWGEPFPIVWVDEADYRRAVSLAGSPITCQLPAEPVRYASGGRVHCALPLPLESLPLELPPMENFKPAGAGESPLANHREWTDVWLNLSTGQTVSTILPRPDGSGWVRGFRETNTMPQWAGSCWYYLRYCDPHNDREPIGAEAERYWKNPDFYIGGAEHAVLHLLYARFWHHFLHDIGVVATPEPFPRLFHQGLILGEDGERMSKSRGNVVNPDDFIDRFGADALRLYEVFMGPLEDAKPWNTQGVEGVHRFLRRIWRDFIDREGKPSAKFTEGPETDAGTLRLLHQTIKKVTGDIEGLQYNTAISQMMIFHNHLQKMEKASRETACQFLQLLAPFAPHFAEELWERLGNQPFIVHAPWPKWEESLLASETVAVGVQVNGKPRGEIQLPTGASESEALVAAQNHPRVATHLAGKTIRKAIYVPGRILNLIVG